MNRDLRFSATAYGLGGGIFFIGYALFEVPSNLILVRLGARRWIARIMISWGIVAAAMMFVRTPMHFYALRFLLGVTEAGFFPGIVFYLSEWFPAAQRGRAMSRFMIAIPLSAAFGNPLSTWLLTFDGRAGLAGWQWLFLLEGIPSVLLGMSVLVFLTDRPAEARWLTAEQRDWLITRLQHDNAESLGQQGAPLQALLHPLVWLAAILYFLGVTLLYSYTLWAPTLIRDALHTSNTMTGLISGGIAALATVAMLIAGTSSDRTGERFFHAAACLLIAGFACLATGIVSSPFWHVVALAFVTIGIDAFLPPFWCIPRKFLHGTAAAAGIALINSVGNLGGFVGPYSLGLLKDTTGSTSGAFIGLAGVAVAGAAICFLMRRQLDVRPTASPLPAQG